MASSRSVHPQFALATITVLTLVAGLLVSPIEASAAAPAKASKVSARKKLPHPKHLRRKPTAPVATTPTIPSSRPSSSSPSVGQTQPTASQPTQPPITPTAPPVPTPAPAPVPPPAPGLSFLGDQIGDFAVAQSAPGAITEVPDPAGSGESVFKMTVSDNDGYPVTPTENPRAELISPFTIEAGDEFWWSAKFFLPEEFPSSTPNFVTLLQGPFGPPAAGTPPFHIEANSGVLKWQRNATYGWDIPWQMPEVRNQWVDVTVHTRFASNGFVELWIDGQQVTFFASSSYNPRHIAPTTRLEMATLDSSNNGGPQALFLQQYRKKGMYPSLTVFQGPLTIGTTREAVAG